MASTLRAGHASARPRTHQGPGSTFLTLVKSLLKSWGAWEGARHGSGLPETCHLRDLRSKLATFTPRNVFRGGKALLQGGSGRSPSPPRGQAGGWGGGSEGYGGAGGSAAPGKRGCRRVLSADEPAAEVSALSTPSRSVFFPFFPLRNPRVREIPHGQSTSRPRPRREPAGRRPGTRRRTLRFSPQPEPRPRPCCQAPRSSPTPARTPPAPTPA